MKTLIKLALAVIVLSLSTQSFSKEDDASCPAFLNQEFKKLHSSKHINLCDLYTGKPMVFVNTASHCGFTNQFTPLEALYQKYKNKGVQVVGFSSNDFNQEAKSEEKAAGICFENYGVTFTMLAPTKVKGDDANPVFAQLAKLSGEQPAWNFNKYILSAKGTSAKHFNSQQKPLAGEIEADILRQLK